MNDLATLYRQLPQPVAREGALRLLQRCAKLVQAGHLIGRFPGELIDQPRARRGTRELLDGSGLVALASSSYLPRPLVARRGELRRRQRVELIGHVGNDNRLHKS